MILKISHDFVNQQIINKLNEIGFNRFHENMENGYSTFEVDYILDGKYKFNTEFEIRESTIKKDTEYHGVSLRTGKKIEFVIERSGNQFKNKDNEIVYVRCQHFKSYSIRGIWDI